MIKKIKRIFLLFFVSNLSLCSEKNFDWQSVEWKTVFISKYKKLTDTNPAHLLDKTIPEILDLKNIRLLEFVFKILNLTDIRLIEDPSTLRSESDLFLLRSFPKLKEYIANTIELDFTEAKYLIEFKILKTIANKNFTFSPPAISFYIHFCQMALLKYAFKKNIQIDQKIPEVGITARELITQIEQSLPMITNPYIKKYGLKVLQKYNAMP